MSKKYVVIAKECIDDIDEVFEVEYSGIEHSNRSGAISELWDAYGDSHFAGYVFYIKEVK